MSNDSTTVVKDSESYRTAMKIPETSLLYKEDRERLRLALDYAINTRNFEIELYWKRSTYFWVFIAGTFAAYLAVLGSDKETYGNYKYLITFAIACTGFVFSFAWVLINRGSKFWQENWEIHVQELSNPVIGPLYETILSFAPSQSGLSDQNEKKRECRWLLSFLNRIPSLVIKVIVCICFKSLPKKDTNTEAYSVSKINLFICRFVCLIWFILLTFSIHLEIDIDKNLDFYKLAAFLVLIVLTCLFCALLKIYGQSNLEKHHNPKYTQHGLKENNH